MQRLRRQVDRIDLKLLKLLQQRIKLSVEIGRTKRRHGAEIYVPGRERELMARVLAHAEGELTPTALASVFREILSSSRAAQGQAPIGLLSQSAAEILLPARSHFGSCDRLVIRERWRDLEKDLGEGKLAAALLTVEDLAAVAQGPKSWRGFFSRLTIVGDFARKADEALALANRVFIVKPRGEETVRRGNRLLILIECKITGLAVKSLLTAMPNRPIHAEHLILPATTGRRRPAASLLGVTLSKSVETVDGDHSLDFLSRAGMTTSIAGIYPASEGYGG